MTRSSQSFTLSRFVPCLLFNALIVEYQFPCVSGLPVVHSFSKPPKQRTFSSCTTTLVAPKSHRIQRVLLGWVEKDGEWEWEEDDPTFVPPSPAASTSTATIEIDNIATPQLPKGKFRPKQSLGQNYLNDPNTVTKMIKAFHNDATHNGEKDDSQLTKIVELGPGTGALTDQLVATYGQDILQCIEIDPRAIEVLHERYPNLRVYHEDVLQIDYPELARMGSRNSDEDTDGVETEPLVVIGNLPYYITSQILFALADASHTGSIDTATVTMQWEVAQRMVAPTSCKDYGILSVVFQTYADVKCHFKIPNTVFYPKPKVDSALVGLKFLGPTKLSRRLAGVNPINFKNVVTTAFRQRRKTIRNSLKKLAGITVEQLDSPPLPLPQSIQDIIDSEGKSESEYDENDIAFAKNQQLPNDWTKKRPEELTPGQFVEVTRLLFGDDGSSTTQWNSKVWRKLKHGT